VLVQPSWLRSEKERRSPNRLVLDKVKDCESVSNRTEDRISVRCENEVSLLVDRSTQVRELRQG
jgi:hypothetical protein